MIDHKHKLIFIHIPRTGGSSIEKALVGKDWFNIESHTKHISASIAKRKYSDVWDEYTTFTVVRNPWDRLVSMRTTGWWDKISNAPASGSFYKFIENITLCPHERYDSNLYVDMLDIELDYIIKFENLQAEFSNMLSDLNIQNIKLPHVYKYNHKPFRQCYDQATRDLVSDIYKADIEKFGYTF